MKNKNLNIIQYLYNKTDLMENQFEEYQNFIRYANVDEVEMLEHLIRKVRRDLMREVLRDIMHIISLTK